MSGLGLLYPRPALTSLVLQAKPFTCDASDKQSIIDAFVSIKSEFPDHQVKVGTFAPHARAARLR